jgi:hypothetical protein
MNDNDKMNRYKLFPHEPNLDIDAKFIDILLSNFTTSLYYS